MLSFWCWAGRVYSAGSNVYGQLGIGDRTVEYRFELTTVEGRLCNQRCMSIGTGTHVSFAVTTQGIQSAIHHAYYAYYVPALSRYVTSQLGQLSLASPGVAKSSTSFGWG